MPIQVDVETLAVSGGALTFGCTFEWVNNGSTAASITCCQSFCTQASYAVPAASNGQAGTASATLRSAPQFYFGDSAFNAPGMPHLTITNPVPVNARNEEKEVA
jgi:hypothetical protein